MRHGQPKVLVSELFFLFPVAEERWLHVDGRHLRLSQDGERLRVRPAVRSAGATGQLFLDQLGQTLAAP